MLPLAAIALSALFLAALCRGDPKRRRAAGQDASSLGTGMRRALVAGVILPGIGLAIMGDTASFCIWLGGSMLAGWFLAQAFRRQPGG